MIKSKKQMFLVIGTFALVMLLGGVTYAFFNYTRTGGANTIRVGRISFASEQTNANTINLTNAFPITRTSAASDTTNTDDVVITITGDTDYSEGIEYLLTATAVENTKNNKTVPISIITSASNLGTSDEEYYEHRGSTTAIHKVLAKETISNNDQLLVGYIPSGATGVNGSVTIRAFLDSDLISISDTYDETNGVSNNMGTTSNWVNGRTNFTTTEWNDISVSFKVKVEANEGTWVEEIRSVNAMNTFPTTITDQKANIKEVYFNKMGATRMQNAYDAATIKADLTYNNEGKVLAWLETSPTDNTKYNLIVASDGDTYLTTGNALFSNWSYVEKIEFNNVNTSRVTDFSTMFYMCSSLTSLNLSSFNMQGVTVNNVSTNNLGGIFVGCSGLVDLNLSSFTTLWSGMFSGCSSLKTLDISGLGNIGSNSGLASAIFSNLTSLERIYVSSSIDFSNQPSGMPIFINNTSLVGGYIDNPTTWDNSNPMDKTYAHIDGGPDNPGYFTDVADKPTT